MLKEHWLSPLIVSTNFEERNIAITNPEYRVIIMDDTPAKYMQLINGEYVLSKNVNVLPVLLPQFESIDAYIEGEFERCNSLYEEYLSSSPYVQHCLNTIFTLLFNNVAVFIYVPEEDDPIVNCVNVLIQYIYARYGIITCTASQMLPAIDKMAIDPSKYAVLIDLLYSYKTIPLDEFCLQYPIEYVSLNPNTAMIICQEVKNSGYSIPENSYEECINFAVNYVYGLKQYIIQKYTNGNNGDKVNIAFTMESIPK